MRLLVSFCNPKLAGLPVLGLFDLALAQPCSDSDLSLGKPNEIDILELPPGLPAIRGFTGLACSDEYVFVATQALEMGSPDLKSPASLLIFDRATFEFRNHAILRTAADTHSLCATDDTLYLASTGRDEVLRLRISKGCVVSEESFWRPEPLGPYADVHHINSLCDWGGDLCISAFGKIGSHDTCAQRSGASRTSGAPDAAREGFIYNITRKEFIALGSHNYITGEDDPSRGLDQPHSLCVVNGDLAYCDSRRMEVAFVKSPKRVSLPGYARGLCQAGDEVVAGTSVGRKFSRSTRRVNNPASSGEAAGQCALHRIDLAKHKIVSTVDLGFCGTEVYDLMPIDNVASWPVADRIEWRNEALKIFTSGVDAHAVEFLLRREELAARIAELESSLTSVREAAKADSDAALAAAEAGYKAELQAVRAEADTAIGVADAARDSEVEGVRVEAEAKIAAANAEHEAALQAAHREAETSIAAVRAEAQAEVGDSIAKSQAAVVAAQNASAVVQAEARAAVAEANEEHRANVGELQSRMKVMRARLDGLQRERDMLGQQLQSQSAQASALESVITSLNDTIRSQEARAASLESVVASLQETILLKSEEVTSHLYRMAAQQVESSSSPDAAGRNEYRQMVGRIRETVRTRLPRGAVVAVASKGDEELLSLYGRKARHFPAAADGSYPGFYPGDSLSAIAQLEAARASSLSMDSQGNMLNDAGADYLLLPSTAFWWLDTYPAFRRHIEQSYRLYHRADDTCAIYSLAEKAVHVKKVGGARLAPRVRGQVSREPTFAALIDEFRERFDRDPDILDWSETGLARDFPRLAIVEWHGQPARDGKHGLEAHATQIQLPYLDRSIELVVVPEGDDDIIAEGRRVAEKSFVVVGRSSPGKPAELKVEWLAEAREVKPLRPSIVIPVFNAPLYTENCLRSLVETLPEDCNAEVFVVDDCSSAENAEKLLQWPQRDRRIRVLRNRENLGFLGSVNRGAREAKGDILILLNNDTLLLSDWLPPLLATFAAHPDAGAVGGRLLYPDGRLQEAGGVVFRDGSAAQFGHRDYHPDATLYRAVREVDYCSGALLATPRALFKQLGGLDPDYGFGYYEDTDYCFRVREAGRKVLYQPDSTIVHVEGGSCGTDVKAGIKRWQVENRERFCRRWSEVLQFQHDPPEAYDANTWVRLAARNVGWTFSPSLRSDRSGRRDGLEVHPTVPEATP